MYNINPQEDFDPMPFDLSDIEFNPTEELIDMHLALKEINSELINELMKTHTTIINRYKRKLRWCYLIIGALTGIELTRFLG